MRGDRLRLVASRGGSRKTPEHLVVVSTLVGLRFVVLAHVLRTGKGVQVLVRNGNPLGFVLNLPNTLLVLV